MNKKKTITLVGCSIFCLGILAVLYAASPLSKDIPRGGFHRSILTKSPISMKSALELKNRDHYIAGTSPSAIYVADYNNPFQMLTLDIDLEKKHKNVIRVELDSVPDLKRFITAVEPPNFYMAHGSMPQLLQGKIGAWQANRFSQSMEYFDGAAAISSYSYVVRAYSRSNNGYELAKKSGQKPFEFHYDLLEKQLDGTFCLDGELHYNTELNAMVYLHFYRNEFVVADSNLTLKYRGHTIDTIRKAKIKVAQIDNKQTSMLAAPPLRVNVTGSTYGKWLFVASNMLSENEEMRDFKNNIVLDVYNLEDGAYLHSFYLPRYKNFGVTSLRISKNYIAVLYDKFLVTYNLSPSVFQKNSITTDPI